MSPLTLSLLVVAAATVVPLCFLALRPGRGADGKRLATLRRYAFMPILFGLMGAFLVGFWHYEREVVRAEAQEHGQPFSEGDFRDRFWSGVFENNQSEMFQLGVEAAMLIALGKWIAYKDDERFDELKAELRASRGESESPR